MKKMKDVIAALLYLVFAAVMLPVHLLCFLGRYFVETMFVAQIYLHGRHEEYMAAKQRGEA
jgi:phosphatidylglycerophosphate synthase